MGADRRQWRHGDPRRPLPAVLRPRLQPWPRPDLRGEHRLRHARGADLPAGRPGPVRAGGVLAVPAPVRRRAARRPRLGAGGHRRRPPAGPRAGLVPGGAVRPRRVPPAFDDDGIPLSEAVRGGSPSAAGQEALERATTTPVRRARPVSSPRPTAGRTSRTPPAPSTAWSTSSPTPASPGPPGGRGEPVEVDGLVRLDATLGDAPDGAAAQATVADLRTTLRDVDPGTLVGRDDGAGPGHPGDRRPRPLGDRAAACCW